MIFNIGFYIATRVTGLLGVSREDLECQHINHFLLILENKNLFPNFRLKWFLHKRDMTGKFQQHSFLQTCFYSRVFTVFTVRHPSKRYVPKLYFSDWTKTYAFLLVRSQTDERRASLFSQKFTKTKEKKVKTITCSTYGFF